MVFFDHFPGQILFVYRPYFLSFLILIQDKPLLYFNIRHLRLLAVSSQINRSGSYRYK